jgi:Ankyrin repeats (many copies)
MITIFLKKKIIPSRNHHNFFLNMSTIADIDRKIERVIAGINRDDERVIADDFIFLRHLGFDFTQYDELHKIDPLQVNIQDSNGNTALHKCVIAGSDKTAALLLSLGADVYSTNAKGQSPKSILDALIPPLSERQESIKLLVRRYETKERLPWYKSKDKKKAFEELKQKTEPLCKLIKEVLDSPFVWVESEHGWVAGLERLMESRAL